MLQHVQAATGGKGVSTMQRKAYRRNWVYKLVAMGLSLFIVGAAGLGSLQAKAWAEQNVVIDSVCSTLGTIAWAAYVAKDYKLLEQVDATMGAIGCFD